MNKAVLIFFVCLIGVRKSNYAQLKKQTSVNVVYKTSILPDSFKVELKRVVELYNSKYGLTYSTLYINDEVISSIIHSNETEEVTLAYSSYQKIYFNSLELNRWNVIKFRDIVKHELFHTLARDTVNIRPFVIEAKDSVIGFTGLSMLVKLHDNSLSGMKTFEEAAAEVCAIKTHEGYASDRSYVGLIELLLHLIEFKFIAVEDLIYCQSQSRLDVFVKKILNIQNTLNIGEIMTLYNVFNNLWGKYDDCNIAKSIVNICLIRSKSKLLGY